MRPSLLPPRTFVLAGLVALSGLGCHGAASNGATGQVCLSTLPAHPAKAAAVATFDEGTITSEEVAERLQQMAAQQRGMTLEQKKGAVRRMAQNQILALEAVKAGLQNDPEVAEALRAALVQRLLHKEVESRVVPPTDAELKSFYDAHQADYARQEMVHAYDLFLPAPRSSSSKVAQAKKKMDALYAQLKAAPPGDFALFGELAAKNSEDPRSRAARGDMRFLSGKEFRASYPPEVVAALDGLKTLGALSPPIQTDAGFYLLKLGQHTEAQTTSFEQVKPQLKTRLLFERRTASFNTFLAEAEQRHHFKVDDVALGQVATPAGPGPRAAGLKPVPLPAPGAPARGPAQEPAHP